MSHIALVGRVIEEAFTLIDVLAADPESERIGKRLVEDAFEVGGLVVSVPGRYAA